MHQAGALKLISFCSADSEPPFALHGCPVLLISHHQPVSHLRPDRSSTRPIAPPQDIDEAELSTEEAKERKIMKLLLKVKNGTPPQRKSALRWGRQRGEATGYTIMR